MARPTAADVAAFTGRAVDDAAVVRVLPVALELLERYYVTDPWTVACSEATLHACGYLLAGQSNPTGLVSSDFGAVYLPMRLPVLDRLLTRRGGFA